MNEVTLQAKASDVEAVAQKMGESASFVIADYQGLSVLEMTELRRNLRAEGCDLKILKNNIARRAAKAQGFDFDADLVGANAIAFSAHDSVAAAKVFYEFAKKNDKLQLKSGVIDGKQINHDELLVYATIPSRDTLLTMLAAGLMGTVRDLSISLNLLAEQMAE